MRHPPDMQNDDSDFSRLRLALAAILLMLISMGVHGAIETRQLGDLERRIQALESARP